MVTFTVSLCCDSVDVRASLFCTEDGILVALEDIHRAARAAPKNIIANINTAIKEMKILRVFIVRTGLTFHLRLAFNICSIALCLSTYE